MASPATANWTQSSPAPAAACLRRGLPGAGVWPRGSPASAGACLGLGLLAAGTDVGVEGQCLGGDSSIDCQCRGEGGDRELIFLLTDARISIKEASSLTWTTCACSFLGLEGHS